MAVSISPWVRAVLWASGGFMRDGGCSRCERHPTLARRRYGEVQIARWVFALRLAREPDRRTREKAAMSAPSTPLTRDPLLAAVTDATAEPHQPVDDLTRIPRRIRR